MRSTTHDRCRARPGRAAFTLVELLVVVSIIALLISILLPSLSTAREQAKTVACMALQKGLASGHATYQSEWNGWLAGSPGTSGSVLLGHSTNYPPDAINTPTERLQTWDWMTPLGLYKSWHNERGKRWESVVSKFLCPKNQFLSIPFGTTNPDWPAVQPMVSYNTIRVFMLWPGLDPGGSGFYGATPPFPEATAGSPVAGGWDTFWLLPRRYVPHVERIGNPSEHVFIADGARYTFKDNNYAISDHDVNWRGNAGGGFSAAGPNINENFQRAFHVSTHEEVGDLAPITYRHKKGKQIGIVVSYFDGHGAYMTEQQSRWPDPWWPKGTRVSSGEMNRPAQRLVEDFFDDLGWYAVRK